MRYTFGQRLAARGVGALSQIVFGFTLRHVRHECRWHLSGPLDAALRDGGQLILAAWHQDVLPLFHYLCQLTLLEQRRRFVMLSSQSFDGELTERTLAPFGFEFVRGSAGRKGGRSALRSLHRHVDRGRDIVVIADGPRPPAFLMKGGPIQLARASGVPLYVARASARPSLILPRSWTRMTLPLPRCDLALFSGPHSGTRLLTGRQCLCTRCPGRNGTSAPSDRTGYEDYCRYDRQQDKRTTPRHIDNLLT